MANPIFEDTTELPPSWGETSAIGDTIKANQLMNDGFLSGVSPDESEIISSTLSPQDLEIQEYIAYQNAKTGTNHTTEMALENIAYEYGDDATPQIANAMNKKAAKWALSATSMFSGGADIVFDEDKKKQLSDVGESFARRTAGSLSQAPIMMSEASELMDKYTNKTAEKLSSFAPEGKQDALKSTISAMLGHVGLPFRAATKAYEKAGEQFPEAFDALKGFGAEQVKKSGEIQSEHLSGKTFKELAESGDYEQLGQDIGTMVAFELPNMATQIALAYFSGGSSLGYMGVSAAGGKRAEKTEDDSLEERVIAPIATGAVEAITEKFLGTQRIMDKIATGKIKSGIINRIKQIATDATSGGLSEGGAQFGGNVIDRLSGEEVRLMSGVVEAATLGTIMDVGAGQAMTPFSVGDATRIKKQNTEEQINEIIQSDSVLSETVERETLARDAFLNPTEENVEALNRDIFEQKEEAYATNELIDAGIDKDAPVAELPADQMPQGEADPELFQRAVELQSKPVLGQTEDAQEVGRLESDLDADMESAQSAKEGVINSDKDVASLIGRISKETGVSEDRIRKDLVEYFSGDINIQSDVAMNRLTKRLDKMKSRLLKEQDVDERKYISGVIDTIENDIKSLQNDIDSGRALDNDLFGEIKAIVQSSDEYNGLNRSVDLSQVLEVISNSDQKLAPIAREILDNHDVDSKFMFSSELGEGVAGGYRPSDNNVRWSSSENDSSFAIRGIVHEAAHSVLAQKIPQYIAQKLPNETRDQYISRIKSKKSNAPLRQLISSFEDASTLLDDSGQYGLTNIDEFVAEALTNTKFQDELNSIKSSVGSKTIWQKFVSAVGRMLYGRNITLDEQSVLSNALMSIDKISTGKDVSREGGFVNILSDYLSSEQINELRNLVSSKTQPTKEQAQEAVEQDLKETELKDELLAERAVELQEQEAVQEDFPVDELSDKAKKAIGAGEKVKGVFRPFVNLTTRISEIDPEVGMAVRKARQQTHKKISYRTAQASDFIKSAKKVIKRLPATKKIEAIAHILNGNWQSLADMGIEGTDQLHQMYNEVAGEIGIDNPLTNYFRRQVKDYEGLVEYLGSNPKGDIAKAIDAAEAKKGKPLTNKERNQVVRTQLNKKGDGINQKRTIDTVEPGMVKFYEDPFDSLSNYIMRTSQIAARKELLGVDERMVTEEGQESPDVVDESVSRIISEKIGDGKLDRKQERELTELLKSELGMEPSPKAVRAYHKLVSLKYVTKIKTVVKQFSDVFASIGENGIENVLGSDEANKWSNEFEEDVKGSLEDIGVNALDAELQQSKRAVIEDVIFKPLSAADVIGKNTLLRSTKQKWKKMSKNDPERLDKVLMRKFNHQEFVDKIISDMQQDKLTGDVSFALYCQMADFHPVSHSEHIKFYIDNPPARILFVLKSFAFKRFDRLYREAISPTIDGVAKSAAGYIDKNESLQKEGADDFAQGIVGLSRFLIFSIGAEAFVEKIYKEIMQSLGYAPEEIPEDESWTAMYLQELSRVGPMVDTYSLQEAMRRNDWGYYWDNAYDTPTPLGIDTLTSLSKHFAGKDDYKWKKDVPWLGEFLYGKEKEIRETESMKKRTQQIKNN